MGDSYVKYKNLVAPPFDDLNVEDPPAIKYWKVDKPPPPICMNGLILQRIQYKSPLHIFALKLYYLYLRDNISFRKFLI